MRVVNARETADSFSVCLIVVYGCGAVVAAAAVIGGFGDGGGVLSEIRL